jgi:hypothetical protein
MNASAKGVSGMRGGWRRYAAGAGGMLALATVIVLATGWGTAVAAQITSVLVTNDAAHPVPIQEQRADAQGNVKVHEQGTANVNVTNSSLSVAEPAPITAGGGARQVPTQTNVRVGTTTATALSIRMTDGIQFVALNDEAVLGTPVEFFGPALGGNASVVLTLAHPVRFDAIFCTGATLGSGDYCSVSWVGDQR